MTRSPIELSWTAKNHPVNESLGIWKSQFLGWEVGRERGFRQKTLVFVLVFVFVFVLFVFLCILPFVIVFQFARNQTSQLLGCGGQGSLD